MARIAGVDLPREKRIEIGLTYIYGIGLTTSKKVLAETGINPDTRVKDLDENDVSKLREYIDHNLRVEGELRSEVSLNIKRLMEIGCYRGIRHRKGYPYADKTRREMLVRVKVLRVQSQARRSKEAINHGRNEKESRFP